jgi:hypothetical protein
MSGIPNVQDGVFDDGYRPPAKASKQVTLIIDWRTYTGQLTEK